MMLEGAGYRERRGIEGLKRLGGLIVYSRIVQDRIAAAGRRLPGAARIVAAAKRDFVRVEHDIGLVDQVGLVVVPFNDDQIEIVAYILQVGGVDLGVPAGEDQALAGIWRHRFADDIVVLEIIEL